MEQTCETFQQSPPDTAASGQLVHPGHGVRHNRSPLSNIVCGVLVVASAYLVPPPLFGENWNLFLTGMAIIIVAMASLVAHGNVARNYWSAANVAAGLWLVISARAMPNVPDVTWAQTCLGIIVTAIALTSLANEEVARAPARLHE